MAPKRRKSVNKSNQLVPAGNSQPLPMPKGYAGFLRDLKARIRNAQIKAVLAVNRELIELYWQEHCRTPTDRRLGHCRD